MKNIIILLLLLSSTIYGQDTIIKLGGDTVLCKMTKASASMLFYTEKGIGKSIEKGDVKYYSGKERLDRSQRLESCKYEFNEYDEFVKIWKTKTKWSVINGGFMFNKLLIAVSRYDNQYLLELLVNNVNPMVISESNKAMLKLTNDEIISLVPDKMYSSEHGYDALTKTSYNYIKPRYYISKDDLEKIRTHNVTKIRVYNSDAYSEIEVTKSKEIPTIVNCVLN